MGLEQFAGILQGGPTVILAVVIWLLITDRIITKGRHDDEIRALEERRVEDNRNWKDRLDQETRRGDALWRILANALKLNDGLNRALLGRAPRDGETEEQT